MTKRKGPLALADASGHVWTRGAKLGDRMTVVDGAKRTRDGYMVADARVARVGVQQYRGYEVGKPDEDKIVLYRPQDEVFAQDSMRSHANKPVTLTHPKEMVDAKNWRQYSKGMSGNDVVRDGDYVRVPLMLTDAETIRAFEDGVRELSVGYTCDIDWTPGVTPTGERYDGVQRDIRTNHHALVPVARGGASLRLGDAGSRYCEDCGYTTTDDISTCPQCGGKMIDDGDDDGMYDADFTAEERRELAKKGEAKPDGSYPIRNTSDLKNAIAAWGRGGATASDKAWIKKRAKALGAEEMLPNDWQTDAAPSGISRSKSMNVTRLIDGLTVAFADEQSMAIVDKEFKRMQRQIADAEEGKKKSDEDADDAKKKMEAKDAALGQKDGQIAALTQQVANASLTDAQIDERIAERIAIIDAAKPHLPQGYDVKGKSLGDIRKAVVTKALGDAVANGLTDDGIKGAFLTISAGKARASMADGLTADFRASALHLGGGNTRITDADVEHANYVKRISNAYKTPVGENSRN